MDSYPISVKVSFRTDHTNSVEQKYRRNTKHTKPDTDRKYMLEQPSPTIDKSDFYHGKGG